jgi:hypothetical protein
VTTLSDCDDITPFDGTTIRRKKANTRPKTVFFYVSSTIAKVQYS